MSGHQDQRTRFVPPGLEDVDSEISRLRYLTRSLALVRNSPICELRNKVEVQINERMQLTESDNRIKKISIELEQALTKVQTLQMENSELRQDLNEKPLPEFQLDVPQVSEGTSCVPKILIAVIVTFLLTWIIF